MDKTRDDGGDQGQFADEKKPEAFTTTHPAVIEAVAKQVRALGATAVIGDSPRRPFTPRWYMEYTGLAGWSRQRKMPAQC